jgi:hypothetical protein
VCIVDNPPVILNSNKKNYDEFHSIKSNDSLKTIKRPLVRSKTENEVSSLNKHNTLAEKTNKLNINSDKKRYTLEFLLSRSDMTQSQQMPNNWKLLNQLYPDVCFNGKIISYFNPNKYFAHWNKVKLQNTELHSFNLSNTITCTTTAKAAKNLPHSKSFHSNNRLIINNHTSSIPSSSSSTSSTDDYMNLKSNNFDTYLKQQTRFIIDNNSNKRNFSIHQQKRFDIINHKSSITKSINNNINNNGVNQALFNNTAAHGSATNAFKYNDRKSLKFVNY